MEYLEVLDFIIHNEIIMNYVKSKLDDAYTNGTEFIIKGATLFDDLAIAMNNVAEDGENKNTVCGDEVLELIVEALVNNKIKYLEELDAKREALQF